MTLTELRYIVAVAQEKHFGRAAKKCNVSQPTLSVGIKKLEEELGITIFERNTNEVRLTPTGEMIVQQAQNTLESAASITEIAKLDKDQLSGELKLGAIYTIGPYLFPDLIPVLHETAPAMPLIIEENYTAVLTEKLKRGDLDVIIIALPFDEPGILTLPLYREPFVVLLPESHPLSQDDNISPSQLANENVLLLGKGHCFRDQVIDICPECSPNTHKDTTRHSSVEGSSLETIRHMVTSGLGITVLPCMAAGADRYSQRLLSIRRFEEPAPARTVALAWRVSYPRPKVIDVLKEAVMKCGTSCIQPVPR